MKKAVFNMDALVKELSENESLGQIKVISSPVERKLGLDDRLYAIYFYPINEEIITDGAKIDRRIVSGLEGLTYVAKKEIEIETLAKRGDDILVNGDIVLKKDGNSELKKLDEMIFHDEDQVNEICDMITREQLKRVDYIAEKLAKSRSFLEDQIEKKAY